MQSTDSASSITAPTRSQKYYIEEGDLVVRVEDTLFRLHRYHIKRAAQSDLLGSIDFSDMGIGRDDDAPCILTDVQPEEFESLMWFFYDSGYLWPPDVDRSTDRISTWRRILSLAKRFKMRQVAMVACHALGLLGAVSGIERIVLCAEHGLNATWAREDSGRIIAREQPISAEEFELLGFETGAKISNAREALAKGVTRARSTPCASSNHLPHCTSCGSSEVVCLMRMHVCKNRHSYLHYSECPTWGDVYPSVYNSTLDGLSLGTQPDPEFNENLRTFDGDDKGGDIYIRAEPEGRTFRLHRYLLVKASPVFADMFLLPQTDDGEDIEGSSEHNPITLQVRADALAALLYFFYDAAQPEPVQSATALWELILHTADMFDMEAVKQTAIYALSREGVILSNTRRVSLCIKYALPRTWARAAFQEICERTESLAAGEIEELGPIASAAVSRAREEYIRGTNITTEVEPQLDIEVIAYTVLG
ncbi:uncharacterized protein SCHCODRAFT_02503295 [Schizophyllum commune H4-8]|nr:uncharacterized protein SCHCODRAFT_02503295 [Schizophyllum commune H4-8]KAI5892068.1 hypothetical protein SCHCODRAFT_02503295 [Schizophyllum commune H4-8]